jgi:hypothetical protein
MAKLITRTWTTTGILGRKVRRTAYGYTLMVNGRRERTVSEDWTKDEALAELVKRQAEVSAGKVTRPEMRTLGQLRDEYLALQTGRQEAVAPRGRAHPGHAAAARLRR